MGVEGEGRGRKGHREGKEMGKGTGK